MASPFTLWTLEEQAARQGAAAARRELQTAAASNAPFHAEGGESIRAALVFGAGACNKLVGLIGWFSDAMVAQRRSALRPGA